MRIAILKSIADTSVIACDEIVSFIDIVSAKVTNAIAANVAGTMLMNSGEG